MGMTLRNHLPFFIEHENPPVDSFDPSTADDGWHRETDGCILYKKILSARFQLARKNQLCHFAPDSCYLLKCTDC